MLLHLSDFVSMFSSAESSDLSAQNALDLLLNMSNARELVGNSLQVGAVRWKSFSLVVESNSRDIHVCILLLRWQC